MSATIDELIDYIKETTNLDFVNSVQFRLFEAVRQQEALYPNPLAMADRVAEILKTLPEETPQENIDELASAAVTSFNKIFTDLMSLPGYDKDLAISVFNNFIYHHE